MTQKFECGDNAALVGYLYDECEPSERRAIEAHLAHCAACAAEMGALSSTRMHLSAWTPPESDLGFRIVSEPRSNVLRPKQWWHQPLPAWAQAAAAVLIFGAGLSLGVIGGGGRDTSAQLAQAPVPGAVTGAADVGASSSNVAAGLPPPPEAAARLAEARFAREGGSRSGMTPAVSRDDLAALEQRLRAEMSQIRTVAAAVPALSSSEAQLLTRVRALIDESEQRQRRELALRTAEVVRDVDAQRQYDFARVQRALGQFEGQTGLEFQRQRQDLNNLIRVSQRPQ